MTTIQAATPQTRSDETAQPGRPGRVVLYIEDNLDNVKLVQRILMERPEVELRIATSARDGVAAAAALVPDLILLDNRLPDGSGAEVLARLSDSPATASIPVIILSSDSETHIARALLALGARDFMAKPLDIYDFMVMVNTYLP